MEKKVDIYIFVCLMFTLCCIQSVAYATTFKYEFVGSVTTVALHEYGETLPDVQVDDTFTGFLQYQFDIALEDQIPGSSEYAAYNTSGSYEVTFNDFTIESNWLGYVPIEVWNSNVDTIRLNDFAPDAGEFWSDDLRFTFSDATGTALSDDFLPAGIDLAAFNEISLWFDIYGASGLDYCLADGVIKGKIDSIYQVAVPVPEPATGLLFLPGLGLLGYVRRQTASNTHRSH